MTYIILPNLHIVLFFINLVIKIFKKLFISYFAMNYIMIYSTIIIPKILNKVGDCIKFGVVEY